MNYTMKYTKFPKTIFAIHIVSLLSDYKTTLANNKIYFMK